MIPAGKSPMLVTTFRSGLMTIQRCSDHETMDGLLPTHKIEEGRPYRAFSNLFAYFSTEPHLSTKAVDNCIKNRATQFCLYTARRCHRPSTKKWPNWRGCPRGGQNDDNFTPEKKLWTANRPWYRNVYKKPETPQLEGQNWTCVTLHRTPSGNCQYPLKIKVSLGWACGTDQRCKS